MGLCRCPECGVPLAPASATADPVVQEIAVGEAADFGPLEGPLGPLITFDGFSRLRRACGRGRSGGRLASLDVTGKLRERGWVTVTIP
eukprot:3330769-Alexandrium_andersonii.AAC.1